jgi:hypothetical protein
MAMRPSLSEIEFNCAVLLSLYRSASGTMTETELIGVLERSKWLDPNLQMSVASRSDTRIANRVHNIVSHRDSKKNMIRNSLVQWHQEWSAFSILPKGKDFLTQVTIKLGVEVTEDFLGIESWLKLQRRLV